MTATVSVEYDAHEVTLLSTVASLFNVNNISNQFSDVQIRVKDETFYCHKLLLQISSSYFSNCPFKYGTETLHHIHPGQMYEVLRFIYTGHVQVNANTLASLLAAADLLSIVSLKIALFSYMADSLNIDCAVLYWGLAQKYEQWDLVKECQHRLHRDFNKINFTLGLSDTSCNMLRDILDADDLVVTSETQVCDTIMDWLLVQTERGKDIRPVDLLEVVRWSDISIDYITSTLINNETILSNTDAINFLTQVLTFKTSNLEFHGLKTFHRKSRGLEMCLVAIALGDTTTDVCRVSLQRADSVTHFDEIQTWMNNASAACTINNTVYVTGAGINCNETWKMDITSGWTRRADMAIGRRKHCIAVIDTTIYVLGGWADDIKTTLKSVKCYNSNTDKWSNAGELIHAVKSAASVTYNSNVYVFGGMSTEYNAIDCVQLYNPTDESCTALDTSIPCRHWMRAVVWDKSAILLGRTACYIFNFDSLVWEERNQFMAGVDYFALVLVNGTVFIAGGADGSRTSDNEWTLACTDQVQSTSVVDIIEDKPAKWVKHAKLSKPAMIYSYCSLSFPCG